LDGLNNGGNGGGGQLCSPGLDAAFEIGVSNSSTAFGTSVGTTALIPPLISPGKSSYTSLSVTFVAPAGSNGFITFQLADQSNANSILFIDNVAITTGTCTVPITLFSFSGKRVNGNDQLTWITASEQNTSQFVVEYGANGNQFSKIGTVAAAGNSSVDRQYQFTNSHINGDAFYRLKTVDIDGKLTYSRVIKLAQISPCGQDDLELTNIAPSPFNDQFIVEYCSGNTTKVNAKLFDVAGRLMAKQDITIPQGQGNFAINDLSKLVPGIYILQLQDRQGNTISKKLVKQ
ncbi:MAG TPA: T9SS type A sorting domain-containing protein, partial [Chitinophagaceae bacterium]